MRDQKGRTATYIYINIYTRNLKFAQLVTELASLAIIGTNGRLKANGKRRGMPARQTAKMSRDPTFAVMFDVCRSRFNVSVGTWLGVEKLSFSPSPGGHS